MAKTTSVSVPAPPSPLRITTGDFLVAGIPACAAGFFMALSGGASGPGKLAGVAIGGAGALLALSLLFAYGSWFRAGRTAGAGRAAFRWTAIILASGSLFTSCSDLTQGADARAATQSLNAALGEYMAIAQSDGSIAERRARLRGAHERRLATRDGKRTSPLDLSVPMADAAWETSLRLLRFGESLERLLAMPGVGSTPIRSADEVAGTLAELERDVEAAANITADLPSIVEVKLREAGVPEPTVQATLRQVGQPTAEQIAGQSARWSPTRRYVSAMRDWLGYLDTHRGRWRYDQSNAQIVFEPGLGAEAQKLIESLVRAETEAFSEPGGG